MRVSHSPTRLGPSGCARTFQKAFGADRSMGQPPQLRLCKATTRNSPLTDQSVDYWSCRLCRINGWGISASPCPAIRPRGDWLRRLAQTFCPRLSTPVRDKKLSKVFLSAPFGCAPRQREARLCVRTAASRRLSQPWWTSAPRPRRTRARASPSHRALLMVRLDPSSVTDTRLHPILMGWAEGG